MGHEKEKVLTKIDKQLGGHSLNPDIIQSFELAYKKFNENFDPNSEEALKIIDEMVDLLTISEKNLETVKNEKAFKRVWNTITGKNKKLAKINSQNLLKVQKGAIYFLQNIAMQHQTLMKTIYFTLERVEKLQIQNQKLKFYLIQLTDEYNEKIKKIESDVQKNKHDIKELNFKFKLILSVISLGTLSFLFTFIFKNSDNLINFVALFFAFFTTLILVFIYYKKSTWKFRNRKGIVNRENIEKFESKIVLKQSFIQTIFEELIEKSIIYYPILEIIGFCRSVLDKQKILDKQEVSEDDGTRFLDEIIKIVPVNNEVIEDCCVRSASEIIKIINEKIKKLINYYFQSSNYLELKSGLDFNEHEILKKIYLDVFEPYAESLNKINNLYNSLYDRYPKMRKITTEKTWVTLLKTLLIFPVFSDEEFINDFIHDIKNYFDSCETLLMVAENTLSSLIEERVLNFIKSTSENLDFLFDEIIRRNADIEKINFESKENLIGY